jgi:hypothetical protein
VSVLVELGGRGHPGGSRPDHRDRAAAAPRRRLGDHPALGERPLDDRELDLLDRHRVVVDLEHTGGLAGGGADEAGELREVVRGVQPVDRLAPAILAHELVPLRDEVVHRAGVVAEGDAAAHAAAPCARSSSGSRRPKISP